MPLDSFSLDRATLKDVSPLLCDEHGVLKVVDASVLSATSLEDRVAFCVNSGSYLLPTTELVAALKVAIGGRTALEIGSGSGVLAKALGIRATDNRMQEWPEVKTLYGSLQQAVVSYGENVEEIDAEEAVRKYKPQVVIAAWVTHKYDPARPHAGGNEHGVIEENIIDNCETYIFVGNSKVHANKSIWERPHTRIEPPWLYSRAINGSADFIAVWGNQNEHSANLIESYR